MIGRRQFLMGTAAAVAAPYVLTTRASAQGPRLRVDVQSLAPSDSFFSKYGQAVQAMHQLPASDPRNWRNQALIHINHCPHGKQSFVHWHRHYIHNFELICGQLIGDTNFALAYWNWSAKQGIIPDPFFDLDLLNVRFWKDQSNAQSNNWGPDPVTTIGTRGLAKGQGLQDDPNAGQDFTQDAIDAIQRESRFRIFTRQLETQPHNNGHVISGSPNGHMIDGVSPLDPIFWLHHCNIDRIWAEWQTAGNTTPPLNLDYNNQFVNGTGQPVTASSASALDFAALGYTYDTLSGPVVAAAQARLGLPNQVQPPAALQTPEPQSLGANNTPQTAALAAVTRFTVKTKDVIPELFRPRRFLAMKVPTVQRVATGGGRIVASITATAPPRPAPIICKVFVNAPNPTADTPSTDPHYAGSFSFFGQHGQDHGAAEYFVDLTKPLRAQAGDGRIDPSQINVQLVPVPAVPGAATEVTFNVEKVELLSA
jgi:tyrosinase